MRSIRRPGMIAAALALSALSWPASARHVAAQSTPKLGDYYVAVGDSFSAGYQLPSLPVDIQCAAPDAPGFTCVFYRYLKTIKPSIQFKNFSEPGADSCELAGAGHRCYDATARANPLDAAVAFITAHPGQVSPITVTIGGNDLLALLPAAVSDPAGTATKLPTVFATFSSNFDTILGRLRTAAGPDAEIIVTTQPNPFGGLSSPPLPAGLPELGKAALGSLNTVMKAEAAKYNAVVADAAAAFDADPRGGANLTYVAQTLSGGIAAVQIHPTTAGYAVYAAAVIKASGYAVPLAASAAPLVLRAHLAARVIAVQGTGVARGQTMAGARVQTTVIAPGAGTVHSTTRVGASGHFTVRFTVGSGRGHGLLVLVARDAAGRMTAAHRYAFAVR